MRGWEEDEEGDAKSPDFCPCGSVIIEIKEEEA